MKFADIIGQPELKNHFATALRRRQFSQAYIIEGETLSGKRMMADAFAATLLCERGGEDACGICHSCKMAQAGSHPDIIHLHHEKPNQYAIREVKEQLVEDAWLKPFYGGYKVYVVDEAEKLTRESQNALLKTLEDPPDYAIIMLLSTSTEHFLPTVRSRCTKLSIAPLSDEVITQQLIRGLDLPEYEAKAVCAFARGNLGKALSLASDAAFSDMKREVLSLLTHLDERTLPNLFEQVDALEAACRDRMGELFDLFVLWYRDVLLFKATGAKDALTFLEEDDVYAISQAARRLSYAKLAENVKCIGHARRQLSEHVGGVKVLQQLVLELKG